MELLATSKRGRTFLFFLFRLDKMAVQGKFQQKLTIAHDMHDEIFKFLVRVRKVGTCLAIEGFLVIFLILFVLWVFPIARD